jgi:hypothetical protein
MNEPTKLDYASASRRPIRWAAVGSVVAGGATMLMDLLWWEGIFAGNETSVLPAAAITFLLPLVGLAIAFQEDRICWTGIAASLAGGAGFLGLFTYALTHLPNC